MKKIFLLTLIAVFATSSMAFAFSPYENNAETVGTGRLESGTKAKVKVGNDLDANKKGAGLAKEGESAKDMLKQADDKTGLGAAYKGSSAGSSNK